MAQVYIKDKLYHDIVASGCKTRPDLLAYVENAVHAALRAGGHTVTGD